MRIYVNGICENQTHTRAPIPGTNDLGIGAYEFGAAENLVSVRGSDR